MKLLIKTLKDILNFVFAFVIWVSLLSIFTWVVWGGNVSFDLTDNTTPTPEFGCAYHFPIGAIKATDELINCDGVVYRKVK